MAIEPPNVAAVSSLATRYDDLLPRVHGFIARRIHDRGAVEELTARVFARAVEGTSQADDGPATGFLFRVAASAVVDHARRQARSIPLGARASDFDEPGDAQLAESAAQEAALRAFAAAIDRAHLRRGLLDLPDDERLVVVLQYFDGLDSDELCAVLGCSSHDLAVVRHRALRRLLGVARNEVIGAA